MLHQQRLIANRRLSLNDDDSIIESVCVFVEGTYHSAKSIQIRTEEPINWKEKQFVRPNCHRL